MACHTCPPSAKGPHMLPHRINAPSLDDLQTSVKQQLAGTYDEPFIIQFSAPEQYSAPVLAVLDELCAGHAERVDVRFYGHHAGQPFDGRTLTALPHVQVLTLDCLYQVTGLEHVAGLTGLSSLAIGIETLDLNPLLACENLRGLKHLRLSQDTGPKLDLTPVSAMSALQGFHLSARSHGLDVLKGHAAIDHLSLSRQPATTPFEVVSTLPALRKLAIGFGSREAMPELFSASVTHLKLCRVRGLKRLALVQFPQLEQLDIEDQAQLARLDLRGSPHLRALRLYNLKTLAALSGLSESLVADLSIYKTPELELLTLLE